MKFSDIFGLSRTRTGATQNGSSRAVTETVSLCHALLSERGEVSGGLIASEILTAYLGLDTSARTQFFNALLKDFSPIPDEVGKAGEAYRQDPSPDNLARLQVVVEPPRQELFRRLNMAPGGTHVLVNMRRDLLQSSQSALAMEAGCGGFGTPVSFLV